MPDQRDALRNIRTFPQLIKFLRDELDWPIESDDFEELTFDYTPEELGIDTASAAKIQEIKRLRPLSASQPWGIFFVKFEPKRLPVVALRRILSRVVLKKRASANSAERAAWQADDLLFISNYGEGDRAADQLRPLLPTRGESRPADAQGARLGQRQYGFQSNYQTMSMTDPIADFLTRVRNAIHAAHQTVNIPASTLKSELARILAEQGYIEAWSVAPAPDGGPGQLIQIRLKYTEDRRSAISGLAGVGLYQPSWAAPMDEVRRLMELNFFALLGMIQLAAPPMRARGSGMIVNLSSIGGKMPLPWLTLYSASKYAVGALTEGLRMELRRDGIRTMLVCPGYVITGFQQHVISGAALLGFFFLPLTTLVYAWIVNSGAGAYGIYMVAIVICVLVDLGLHGHTARSSRN